MFYKNTDVAYISWNIISQNKNLNIQILKINYLLRKMNSKSKNLVFFLASSKLFYDPYQTTKNIRDHINTHKESDSDIKMNNEFF